MSEPIKHDEHHHHVQEVVQHQISEHRFAVLIISSIIVSIILTMMSLALYRSSGTSQLDLSRPGLDEVRKKALPDDTYNGFSSSGALDKASFKEFDTEYSKKLKELGTQDAFANDVLSPKVLQIDAESVGAQIPPAE